MIVQGSGTSQAGGTLLSLMRLLILAALLSASCGGKTTTSVDAGRSPADASVDAAAPVDLEPELVLTPSSFGELQGWADDDHLAALGAFRRSCRALVKKKSDTQVGLTAIAGTVANWKGACTAAARPSTKKAARLFFEEHFVVKAASNNRDAVGRFTGYYNAHIRGSRKKRGAYQTPVWGRPKDLVSADLSKWSSKFRGERVWGKLKGKRLVPFDSRAEIYAGSLRKRAKILLYADDPIDVFFAQVQGSAIVSLEGGGQTRIGVAGKNGRIYTAIGRVLIAEGELTRATVSMQSIRAWMLEHPKEAQALMEKNEAFVFFGERKGDGPHGAQGVVLTPGRSLAVDLRWLPMSAPLWVETEVPSVSSEKTEPYRRLLIAQDTGGAIRGPVRGDIYFGDDAAAFAQAGRMKGVGSYHILLPKSLE